MGKYKIKIDYKTGDSFKTYNTSNMLELEWDNFDIAKENLKAIKEHYTKVYKNIDNSFSSRTEDQEICKENENEWWFVKSMKLFCISEDFAIDEKDKKKYDGDWEYRFDTYYATHCIKLKTDAGKFMQMGCFWTGYFERLNGAEIVVDESDTKFEL